MRSKVDTPDRRSLTGYQPADGSPIDTHDRDRCRGGAQEESGSRLVGTGGSKPGHRRTGSAGYRGYGGSVTERSHRRKVEPRAVAIHVRADSGAQTGLRPPAHPGDAWSVTAASWRRGWDSNPRSLSTQRFSRAPPSTARPPLRPLRIPAAVRVRPMPASGPLDDDGPGDQVEPAALALVDEDPDVAEVEDEPATHSPIRRRMAVPQPIRPPSASRTTWMPNSRMPGVWPPRAQKNGKYSEHDQRPEHEQEHEQHRGAAARRSVTSPSTIVAPQRGRRTR